LAVQYENTGTAGWTFGLNSGGTRYSNDWIQPNTENAEIYYMNESGAVSVLTNSYNSTALGAGNVGALIIPMENLHYQFGTQSDTFFSSVSSFTICTNSQYNYLWELKIGEIGYYD